MSLTLSPPSDSCRHLTHLQLSLDAPCNPLARQQLGSSLKSKPDHITLLLKMLHWHPIKLRIKSQLLTLTYASLRDQLCPPLTPPASDAFSGFCLRAFVLDVPSACNTCAPIFRGAGSCLCSGLSSEGPSQSYSIALPCFNSLQSPQTTRHYFMFVYLFVSLFSHPWKIIFMTARISSVLFTVSPAPRTGPAHSGSSIFAE